jgi:hypothetical protein
MKIPWVGAKLLHADRQTDRYDEANIHVSQFCDRAFKTYILSDINDLFLQSVND